MRKFAFRSIVSSFTVLVACGTPAVLAADQAEAMPASAGLTGYVDVRGGLLTGHGSDEFDGLPTWEVDWNGYDFGGAGRVAVPFEQALMQLDAWFTTWGGNETSCYDEDPCDEYEWINSYGGIGVHLGWALDDGTTVGGLASLGFEDDDIHYANVALEATSEVDAVRLYGQVGYTGLINDDGGDVGFHAIYAHGVVGYYIDPNLVVSANLGVSQQVWEGDWGMDTANWVTWGARVEKKFEDTPMSAYLAYQGSAWNGENSEEPRTWSGTEHAVFAGFRVAFGDSSATLRDLDRSVGLSDLNPAYGDLPH